MHALYMNVFTFYKSGIYGIEASPVNDTDEDLAHSREWPKMCSVVMKNRASCQKKKSILRQLQSRPVKGRLLKTQKARVN